MADLLECVIQIKALGEALDLAALAAAGGSSSEPGPASVPGVWQRMAGAERRYAEALGIGAAGRTAFAATGSEAGRAGDEFMALRRANLAVLDGCTADQLAGAVAWPGRPSTTVADLVAIMLGSDTELLGEWRRRARPPAPRA
jgi:hypothetical protein